MNFKPDPSKQAKEVIFSKKRHNSNHDSIYLNHNSVQQGHFQKHLGMHLDTKLNFQEYLNNSMSKADKSVRPLTAGKLRLSLATQAVLHVSTALKGS